MSAERGARERGARRAGRDPGRRRGRRAPYVGQALKALVMHEVGHTLGLRHNFRGSAGANAAQLANRGWTASHGLGVSVMDYSPPALALDPARQGDYYAPTIGSYDRWAITYGYGDVVTGPPSAAAKGGGRGRPVSGPPTSRSTGFGPSPRRRRTRRTCTAPTRTRASAASDSIPPSAATIRPTTRSAGRADVSRSSTACSTRSRPGSWRRARATAGSGRHSPTCSTTAGTRCSSPPSIWAAPRPPATTAAIRARARRWSTSPRHSSARRSAFLADAGFGERAYRFPPGAAQPARRGPLDALGRVTGSGRPARFPTARLGADAAGLAARAAARSHRARPDPGRRAPRRARESRRWGCRSCSPP